MIEQDPEEIVHLLEANVLLVKSCLNIPFEARRYCNSPAVMSHMKHASTSISRTSTCNNVRLAMHHWVWILKEEGACWILVSQLRKGEHFKY